jgi:hypothetical protein
MFAADWKEAVGKSAFEKGAGRGWHHHSRAPLCRSIGAGDDRLKVRRAARQSVPIYFYA